MRIYHALSETPIGRALLAYFFDLPRWTLVNAVLALSLVPALFALLQGAADWITPLCFPAALVSAGMVNMAARQASDEAPRWRDIFCSAATYRVAFTLWLTIVVALALLSRNLPTVLFFLICAVVLALLMIGVFALFVPSLLKVRDMLVWRNALVLAVVNPVVALGLLALIALGAWAIWSSRGALIFCIPALWTLIAAFSVQDRITAFQSALPERKTLD